MLTATQELWGYRALVMNLTNRQIKSQFKMTFLGNMWALINPTLTLAVYSLVFGYFLSFHRNTPEAWASGLQSFPLYLFCALMMWWLFNRVAIGATAAFTQMGSLLRKVYFPPGAPIVAHGLAQVRQTMLEGLVCMLVMCLVGNTPWTFILWPLLIPLMLAFGLGMGMLLALANAYYKDVGYLTTILNMLLFYVTPIIYSVDAVGDTEFMGVPVKTLMQFNPLTQFVEASRELLYLGEIPGIGRMVALAGISILSLVMGWVLFVRYSRDVSEVV
jgi:ABC-type polysaccharide/polyol phosphate export permease